MKYIADLKDSEHVIECYLCKDVQKLLTKANKEYMKLTLEDRTKSIQAMIWDISGALIGKFKKGDVVKVDAFAQLYQNTLQLNVTRIRVANPGEYDPEEMFRSTKNSVDKLYQRAVGLIDSIEDPGIRQLVEAFYTIDAVMIEKLKKHPAAKSIHHDYIGGLLEHSVSVAEYADGFRKNYQTMRHDLLIAGGLLHDIGKLRELTPMPNNDYSDAGRLLGHITIGYQMVHETGVRIGLLKEQDLMQIEHMILSHHGVRDYGSPVVPETMEAMALHMADLCDSHLKQIEEQLEADTNEGSWTGYNRTLERYFYKPEKS